MLLFVLRGRNILLHTNRHDKHVYSMRCACILQLYECEVGITPKPNTPAPKNPLSAKRKRDRLRTLISEIVGVSSTVLLPYLSLLSNLVGYFVSDSFDNKFCGECKHYNFDLT